ncbi:MAG: hypothetical protein FJ151_00575 [Euryarchaeota archaeon]|nr:hypothetical protein [Euryarchaeota archaeon]
MIVAGVVILLFLAFLAIMLGTVWSLGDGSQADGLSLASKILTVLGALFIIAIVLAVIISAITWGQWLGDLRGGEGERGEVRSSGGRISPAEELDRRYARGGDLAR